MFDLLFVIAGAAIALFSYSMGRNNAAPLPKFHIPYFSKNDNGQPAESKPPPAHSRGM